jgi:AraC-like DNA-binding protein
MKKKSLDILADEFNHAINPRVLNCGYYQAPAQWKSSQRHDIKAYFDLLYIVSGSGEFKISGKWFDFQAGDLITIKPGEVFQQDRTGSDPFCIAVMFVLPFGLKPGIKDSRLSAHWPRKLPFQSNSFLEDYFNQGVELFTTKPDGYVLSLKILAMQILEIIFQRLQHHDHPKIPPITQSVLLARQYIESHYQDDITLDQLSEYCQKSASYLMAQFQRHCQTSPIDYLINYRLRMAKVLLAKGLSVSQTAEKTGFHSLHYFSRTFTKRIKVSPSEFARSVRLR